ncbi:MAG TPA: type 1 periplasmic binding fold superfamily protein [Flavobacteriales bacterium]|nr:type 1 periplasmic binding fold superfamily protein [Flavobacteriales bacterium]
MIKSTKLLALTLLAALALAGCKKKDDGHDLGHGHDHNEEELITTVKALFMHATTGDTVEFSWEDLDGDGGNAPVITGGTVQMGAAYAMRLLLLNESVTPSDTISNEVAQEAEAHQFFFSTTGGSLGWEGYLDADANGLPIGLLTQWSTGVPGTGNITIILRHEPSKSAAGVSAGDITNAGGETDIEVTIPYTVL